MKRILLFISLFLFIVALPQLSALSLIENLETTSSSGDLNSLSQLLQTAISTSTEESAAIEYYKTRMQISMSKGFEKYSELISKYPGTLYAQKAYLEKGKMHLLKRKYVGAIMNFEKIDDQLTDRDYYLAKAYNKKEQYSKAISAAEAFLMVGSDPRKIENTYFLIAEIHLVQNKYEIALQKLIQLRDSDFLENAGLLFYKIGYCYEKTQRFPDAVTAYKKVLVDFPVSMYRFQAEDRLYGLEQDGAVDVTELSTYIKGSVSKELPPEKKTEIITEKPELSTTEHGKFLQVGAFGSMANAQKMQKRMQSKQYPCIIFSIDSVGKPIHKVAIGPYANSKSAKIVGKELKTAKINYIIITR